MAILGHVDYISRSYVQGWACDKEYPDRQVSVIIKVNGVVAATLIADRPREGLQQATDGQARDNTEFRFDFDPPLSVFQAQDIEVLGADDQRVLPNGRRVIPAPVFAAPETAALRPVLLNSTGRSGSTMMMNELLGHPEIVIGNRYPFEIKQIAYFAAAFRNLVLDADRVKSTHPETMLSEKARTIGSNPYCTPGLFDLAQPKSLLQSFYEAEIWFCAACPAAVPPPRPARRRLRELIARRPCS